MSDVVAGTPALTPEQIKKQAKTQRERSERVARHAALAARIEADRAPSVAADAEAGTRRLPCLLM